MSFLIVIGFVLAVMAHIKIYMIQHAMLNLVSSMSQKLTDMETNQQLTTKTEVMRIFEAMNAINAKKSVSQAAQAVHETRYADEPVKIESDPVIQSVVPDVQVASIEADTATSGLTQTESKASATDASEKKKARKRKEPVVL